MRLPIHPCVLTIAGSDSGGNAGVQADLRAFHCYGLHGCTAFAALTAQNPRGVRSVLPVPASFLADQLDAVFEMYSVKALKTGMLATAEAIETVAAALAAELACGASLPDAVAGAKDFVHEAIRLSYRIGKSCGVLGMPRGKWGERNHG